MIRETEPSRIRRSPALAVRPGEIVQTDTTPLDEMALLDEGVPGRGELTTVLDVATHTICAAVAGPYLSRRLRARHGPGSAVGAEAASCCGLRQSSQVHGLPKPNSAHRYNGLTEEGHRDGCARHEQP